MVRHYAATPMPIDNTQENQWITKEIPLIFAGMAKAFAVLAKQAPREPLRLPALLELQGVQAAVDPPGGHQLRLGPPPPPPPPPSEPGPAGGRERRGNRGAARGDVLDHLPREEEPFLEDQGEQPAELLPRKLPDLPPEQGDLPSSDLVEPEEQGEDRRLPRGRR